MTERARIESFVRWLKKHDQANYAEWTRPSRTPPTTDDLHRLGLCNGVNHALGHVRAKFVEIFADADVNWADVFDCDIVRVKGREWHRSNPITEDNL
jgi:hypothetical protein